MNPDDELERIKQEKLKRMMKMSKSGFWKEGEVMTLTDTNFHPAIAEADKPVLVDFWAEWCAPCKMMAPIVHQMALEYKEKAFFGKLETDQNRVTSGEFRVMSIPNFIVFKDGKPVAQKVGAVGKQGLKSMLKGFI